MKPEDILPTYERQAQTFDRTRGKSLFERPWLDRFLDHAPRSHGRPRILDLGCGSGRPIAQYLSERRCDVTGIDGAAAMVELFHHNLPHATVHHADMRGLDLGTCFDGILAWNSFFHLTIPDQRAMFDTFDRHIAPGAVLMFTSGHGEGEAIGHVGDETVYHASLTAQDYTSLMAKRGIEVIKSTLQDPDCNGHSVWLARKNIS